MLPKPDCAFNIPSLHDDVELSCRLYFPRPSPPNSNIVITGFAVFAHPYAPLGGCYDDPMVQTIGTILLKQKFVLCTFNFRGAAGSPGSTSWTGKAELADYVSICTFLLCMISDTELRSHVALIEDRPLLLLGGYSYGSMIASHLPDIQFIQQGSQRSQLESTDHEIELKAEEVTKVLLGYLETNIHRGRKPKLVEDNVTSTSSMRGVVMGGYDSDSANRRASRESSRRSIDVERVRHSIERVRNKFNPKVGSTSSVQHDNERHMLSDSASATMFEPRVAYLLVSPLLQIVAGFTTVFSKLVFERYPRTIGTKPPKAVQQNLTENPTLAIYGDKDVFTSSRQLRKWSQELQKTPNSQFSAEEVTGAGHFWQEHEAVQKLRTAVDRWLTTITHTRLQDQTTV